MATKNSKNTKKGKKGKKGKNTKKSKSSKYVKKKTNNFISNGSFSLSELDKYVKTIKKLRKNKTSVKKKKVGLTNTISFLNLLFNADKEKQKKPRKNLLVAHPFQYASLINNKDVPHLWNSTRVSSSKSSDNIINNFNNIYKHLVAFNLMKFNDYKENQQKSLPSMSGPKEVHEIHKIDDSDEDEE